MAAFTGLAKASASLTQLNLKNPQRFEAATLLEIAEVGKQQSITNEILAVNTQIAYQNSTLIRGVLDVVNQLQEVSQRERTLKELLYQMTKLLKADEAGTSDPVEIAFRARVFLHTVASHHLNTHDLADLEEKALFDKLHGHAQDLLKSPAYSDLETFEAVYAMYASAKKEDPCRDLTTPVPPNEPTLKSPEPPKGLEFSEAPPPPTVEAEIASTRWAAMAGAAVMTLFFLGCASGYNENRVASVTGMVVWGAGIGLTLFLIGDSFKETKDPKKLAVMRKELDERHKRWAAAKNEWDKKQEPLRVAYRAAVAKAQEEYELAKIKYADQVADHSKKVKKREQQKKLAVDRHLSLLKQMRERINAFLDEHGGLQQFLPKV